jgi:hypothetical protein
VSRGVHELDSGALQDLNSILGATGGDAATVIDSGLLQLALNANAIVRRGRTPSGSAGIFTARLANAHSGAGSLTNDTNPYSPTAPGAGFPATDVAKRYDVWILASRLSRTAGASALVSATLQIRYPATRVAFGSSSATLIDIRHWLVSAYPMVTLSGDDLFRSLEGAGAIALHHPIRIGEGGLIRYISDAAGAATFSLDLLLGVFPKGLGQDIIGSG